MNESPGIANGFRNAHLITEKRHVGDDERSFGSSRHRLGVMQDRFERDRESGLVALDHHPERVSHQENIDARAVQQARHGGVVHREHGDLLATALFLFEVADPDLPGSLGHLASMFAQQFARLRQSRHHEALCLVRLLLLVLVHVLDIWLV